jgi:hypothetical protein
MEQNWTKKSDSLADRWYDEDGIIVKVTYHYSNFTSYYDREGRYHRLDGPAHTRGNYQA